MSTDDPFGDFDTVDDRPPARKSASRGSGRSRPSRAGADPGRRPRSKPSSPRRPSGGSGAGVLQQPGARLLLALAAAALLILVLTLAIRSCRQSALVDSYKSYVTEASQITAASAAEGKRFQTFVSNEDRADSAKVQARLTGVVQKSDELVARAKKLTPPDSLTAAHNQLISALELRSRGVRGVQTIGKQIAARTGAPANAAQVGSALARQMGLLQASDVNYRDIWASTTKAVLKREKVNGTPVPDGDTFLINPNWSAPIGAQPLIANLSGSAGTGTTTTTPNPGTATGLHGNGLLSVVALPSATTLTTASPTTLKGAGVRWKISVQNQGDSTEPLVEVTATWNPANGGPAQPQSAKITDIAAKATQTVEISGPTTPSVEETGTLKVEVKPVDGEKKTDNNSAEYQVKFTL